MSNLLINIHSTKETSKKSHHHFNPSLRRLWPLVSFAPFPQTACTFTAKTSTFFHLWRRSRPKNAAEGRGRGRGRWWMSELCRKRVTQLFRYSQLNPDQGFIPSGTCAVSGNYRTSVSERQAADLQRNDHIVVMLKTEALNPRWRQNALGATDHQSANCLLCLSMNSETQLTWSFAC